MLSSDSYYVKSTCVDKILEAVVSTYKGESWIDSAAGKAWINDARFNIRKEEKLIDERKPKI